VEAACETAVRVAKRVQPDAKTARLMDLQYVEYRKLYPALKVIQHNFN
jgi:hypothetical protein